MGQEPANTSEKPRCRYCDKQLFGRAGKIFCNVDCKNNFNSQIRSAKRAVENELFPNVISAIKNNYRILLACKLTDERQGVLVIEKNQLKNLGFDPQYCTTASVDANQKLWKCCFHQCWSEEGEYFFLKYDRTK